MSIGRRIWALAASFGCAVGLLGAVGAAPASAAATHFVVSAPATATAGTSFSFTVTAKDGSNATVTNYAGPVHFTTTDAGVGTTLPADSIAFTNGVGTFNATLVTAGSQTVTATDTNNSSITGTSGSIAVHAAAATHFSISAPSHAAVGQSFSFTATARDQFNNVATGYAGTVHFTSTDAQAVLPANSTLTSGTGTFSATLKTASNETLTATDSNNGSITGTSNSITVGPAPTHLTLTGPSSATAGGAFSVTVTARDGTNAVVPGYTDTVHLSSGDGQAVLPADSTLVNGTGTFSVTLKTAGSQAITVKDVQLASIVPASVSLPVSPGATSLFAISAPASTTAGVAIQFSVAAQDAFGNSTPAYAGTVHFSSTDGAASLPADGTLTSGAGTFAATLKTAGARTIAATDTASSSVSGTSNTINVAPAAAARLVISAPGSATAGRSFGATVRALDQFGNLATGYGGTVHFTSSDRLATLPSNSRLTGGTRSFTITLRSSGRRTITAADTVTRSLTAGATVSLHGTFLPAFVVKHTKHARLGKKNAFTVPGVSVRCPSGAPHGCRVTGSAKLATGKAGDARRRAAKPLATLSITVRGGSTRKLTMKLTRAGLARLRGAGTLRLSVKLTASVVGGSGRSVTRTFTLSVR